MVESEKKVNTPETEKSESQGTLKKIDGMFSKIVNKAEVWILIVAMVAMTVLLIANIIGRKFFAGIFWAEEVTTMLIQIITFVGTSYGVRKGRHIRMGALFDLIGEKKPKIQKGMNYVICIYSGALMFIMTYFSWNALQVSRATIQSTPALGMPYWYTYVLVVVGFGLAGINYLRTVIKNITEPDVWISPEQKGEYEDEEDIMISA